MSSWKEKRENRKRDKETQEEFDKLGLPVYKNPEAVDYKLFFFWMIIGVVIILAISAGGV